MTMTSAVSTVNLNPREAAPPLKLPPPTKPSKRMSILKRTASESHMYTPRRTSGYGKDVDNNRVQPTQELPPYVTPRGTQAEEQAQAMAKINTFLKTTTATLSSGQPTDRQYQQQQPGAVLKRAQSERAMGSVPSSLTTSPVPEMLENFRLKEEVKHLQNALVDKMRGSKKFVSGGQFKGLPDDGRSGKCSSCAYLRNVMRQNQGDYDWMKNQNYQMNAKLEEVESINNQFITQMDELRDELQRQQQLNDELATEINAMRQENNIRDAEGLEAARSDWRGTEQKLRGEIEELKNAANHHRETSNDIEDALIRAQQHVATVSADLTAARGNLAKELEHRQALEEEMEKMKKEFQAMYNDKAAMEHNTVQLDECKRALASAESGNEMLLGQITTLEEQLREKEAEATSLKEERDRLFSDTEGFERSMAEMKEFLNSSRMETQRKLEEATRELESTTRQLERLREEESTNAKDIRTLTLEKSDALRKVQEAETRLRLVEVEMDSLKRDLEKANKENSKLNDKANEAYRLFESTLQSLTHLYVVAPTVNVSFGGNETDPAKCRNKLSP
eukprot:GFYU01013579.1.p1 GENE.GFYU01013579.1~~GFYU01013579.1.p1  ORF type:complete len:564 (+),score=194.14 GFYU01013579.1:107-1798(+)